MLDVERTLSLRYTLLVGKSTPSKMSRQLLNAFFNEVFLKTVAKLLPTFEALYGVDEGCSLGNVSLPL